MLCRGPAFYRLCREFRTQTLGAPPDGSRRPPWSVFEPDGLAQAASLKKVQVRARSSQVGSKPAKQRRAAVLAMVTEGWERSVGSSRTRAPQAIMRWPRSLTVKKQVSKRAVARIAHTHLSRALLHVVHSLQATKRCRAPQRAPSAAPSSSQAWRSMPSLPRRRAPSLRLAPSPAPAPRRA